MTPDPRAIAEGLIAAIGDWAMPTGANGMIPAGEDHPLCVAAANARAALATLPPQGSDARETYAEWQQKRGRLADAIDGAIVEYDEWMKDDDYDAHGCLAKIITGLRQARDEAALSRQDRPEGVPIDMILFCPECGFKHVDEPEPGMVRVGVTDEPWTNPPHRSHLCHACGCIWRPADVPTNGVAAIKTTGKADTINLAALASRSAPDDYAYFCNDPPCEYQGRRHPTPYCMPKLPRSAPDGWVLAKEAARLAVTISEQAGSYHPDSRCEELGDAIAEAILALAAAPPAPSGEGVALRKALADAVEVLEHVNPDGTDFDASVEFAIEQGKAALSPSSPTVSVETDQTVNWCPSCGGSGFSGHGSGYGDVCGECGGQRYLPSDSVEGAIRDQAFEEAATILDGWIEAERDCHYSERDDTAIESFEAIASEIRALKGTPPTGDNQ